ncbi:MAG: PAS domain-containing protein, partial [Anaerolineae bacterium]|nr:PAS domain-containing protein [Anaerolineae bacterium]
MLASLNRKISPPVFADDLEKTRQASVLNAVLWIIIGMVIFNFVITILLVPDLTDDQFSSLIFVGVAGLFLYLLRRGWVRFSSFSFLTLCWAAILSMTGLEVGLFDSFVFVYAALVVMAGVLLGTKGAVGYSVLCLGTIVVTVYLPNQYGTPIAYHSTPNESLLNYILTFAILAALLALSDYSVQQALRRARLSELAVRDSEERLRLALEAAQLGDWRWNLLTGEIEWGDQVARIFGLQGGQKDTYESILSLIDPDYWPRLEEAVRQAGEHGEFSTIELEITRPDRVKRWVAAYGKPYRDSQGKVVRLTG